MTNLKDSNIPIYRAKKIDSDEYVVGYLNYCKTHGLCFIAVFSDGESINYDVDSSTLSIHYPNMLDSEGKKIFASLSESGKGGDRLVSYNHYFNMHDKWQDFEDTVKLELGCYTFDNTPFSENDFTQIKVIGVQK